MSPTQEPPLTPTEALRELRLWLKHYWEHYSWPRRTLDECGHVVNTHVAVEIPDWDVRQKLQLIDDTLGDANNG